MADEGREVIFGRDATGYESARPHYPQAGIEHIRSLVEASRAVEVGAGTGKATEAMAVDGLHLTCLEPAPRMAAVLDAKALPGVDVVVSTFEDWDGPPGSIDLIYAAQAWHWIDGETGLSKAMTLLRPGGVIALMWNIPFDRYGPHREIYERHAPHLLEEHDERIERRDSRDWRVDLAQAGFVDIGLLVHEWETELTSAEYRALYSTYSDHMMLDEPVRARLLAALAADVDDRGGTARVDYRTSVYSGRKPDPAGR